ncbi:MAG: hypothetical protein Q9187_001035 [Circinaria calcarea]
MSLGTKNPQRSDSPLSPEQSFSVNGRTRNRDDDALAKKDKGYRRYASGVERVLSLFDTAFEEWADYISFLGRLLKALQAKPAGIDDIPHKALVARRLSQCLNPVLPSGVHQKTLDLYVYIFSSLGRDRLSMDLSLYLPGLTPVLSFASLSVKPAVLTLFENFILTLDPRSLRPALRSVILALLPGLEEESSEEFERTMNILTAFKDLMGQDGENVPDTVPYGHQFFWQCLFLSSITSSSRRTGALAYLSRNLPHLGVPGLESLSLETNGHIESDMLKLPTDVEAVTSPDPGLLIRCFCAGLGDSQLLIQRGFLDLLVTHLPLHSAVFQYKIVREDLVKLVAAASLVVTRRDMSLNRRLWAWFLGPEPPGEANDNSPALKKLSGFDVTTPHGHGSAGAEILYFQRYGLSPLVQGILGMIEARPIVAVERARPLRVCLSLMDRWEIGGYVIPQVFLPAIKSVWQYQDVAPSRESYAEVLRSANMFFDGIESGLIWSEIFNVVGRALDQYDIRGNPSLELLNMVMFIATNFNIREEEMLVVHMPLTCLTLLLRVQKFMELSHVSHEVEPSSVAYLALKIAYQLLELIPERAFATDLVMSEGDVSTDPARQPIIEDDEILKKVEDVYAKNQGNLDLVNPPFAPDELGTLLLKQSMGLVTRVVHSDIQAACNETIMAIFAKIIRMGPRNQLPATDTAKFNSALLNNQNETGLRGHTAHHFATTAAKVSALEIIFTAPQVRSGSWIPDRMVRQLIPQLIVGLWPSLSPSKPKHNVEAARYIWRLQSIFPDRQIIESTLASLIMPHRQNDDGVMRDTEGAQRFATLWAHSPLTSLIAQNRRSSALQARRNSVEPEVVGQHGLSILERPLLLLLDVLEDPRSVLFLFVTSWLQSLPSLNAILGVLIYRLQTLSSNSSVPSEDDVGDEMVSNINYDDLDLVVYYLQTILHLMQYSTNNVWLSLTSFSPSSESQESGAPVQVYLSRTCLNLLGSRLSRQLGASNATFKANQIALSMIRQFLLGPSSNIILEIGIETTLIDELIWSIEHTELPLQASLIDAILIALRARIPDESLARPIQHRRITSKENPRVSSGLPITAEKGDQRGVIVRFLKAGTLDSTLKSIQTVFEDSGSEISETLEPTISLLLNGLEQSLATAHDRLMTFEILSTPIKSPEPPQGFFGNMVSGVFASDTNRSRTMTANNRLTVLLCFKDAVRICFRIWSWGDFGSHSPPRDTSAAASFNYTTLRLRNRTRRIFEHLFAAEALECLETLIELWCQSVTEVNAAAIINLLHVLDGSRPKNTIPAVFDAIYSRTNPNVLDPVRKSTLTSSLSDINLSAFLVSYAQSLDDDAMDEIWTDCMTFLKDVLANPMPHRQTLPRLLEFTAILGEKVDNTSFGEQRKLRRELGDLFVRLLTATLTIRPIGFSHESPSTNSLEKGVSETSTVRRSFDLRTSASLDGLVPVLAIITPKLSKILLDSDRVAATVAIISAQVLVPTFRSKAFPENITIHTLHLLISLGSIPEAAKAWKKDVTESFNDPKFFASSLTLVETGWMPVLRHWVLSDKERMPELISRLAAPTAAGLVFGVGASSARLEADRKTQLNLRRIAILILAAADDTFVVNLTGLQAKLIDLMNATSASSPSSLTRAEIYLVIRALVLKTSAIHLSSFWPTIYSELRDALSSAFPSELQDALDASCLLQACKLLDILLTLGLEDFQMHQWLFITDTTDAVYRPQDCNSAALVDELAKGLDSSSGESHVYTNSLINVTLTGKRRPLLSSIVTKGIKKEEIMEHVLRPFFRQLSIFAFESTYSMEAPDWKACYDDLIVDLFNDSTLV